MIPTRTCAQIAYPGPNCYDMLGNACLGAAGPMLVSYVVLIGPFDRGLESLIGMDEHNISYMPS